jgi:hypothetical protein
MEKLIKICLFLILLGASRCLMAQGVVFNDHLSGTVKCIGQTNDSVLKAINLNLTDSVSAITRKGSYARVAFKSGRVKNITANVYQKRVEVAFISQNANDKNGIMASEFKDITYTAILTLPFRGVGQKWHLQTNINYWGAAFDATFIDFGVTNPDYNSDMGKIVKPLVCDAKMEFSPAPLPPIYDSGLAPGVYEVRIHFWNVAHKGSGNLHSAVTFTIAPE